MHTKRVGAGEVEVIRAVWRRNGKSAEGRKKVRTLPRFPFLTRIPRRNGGERRGSPMYGTRRKKKTLFVPRWTRARSEIRNNFAPMDPGTKPATSSARYLPYQTFTIIRRIIIRRVYLWNFAEIGVSDPGNWRESKAIDELPRIPSSIIQGTINRVARFHFTAPPTRRLYELFWK